MSEIGVRVERVAEVERESTGGAANETRRLGAGVRRGRVTNFHLFAAVAMLFLMSNGIFATALRAAPAAVVLTGCAALGALLLRAPRGGLLSASLDKRSYAACAMLSVALCALGGQGHFFYSPGDWLVRDAVLHDLVGNGFGIVYRYENQDYLLRAPLGLYMIPAVVGSLTSLYGAHLAMLAQNAFILSVIAYFVLLLAQVRKVPMLLLFLAFSGMDIVGVAAAEAASLYQDGALMSFSHIEWWLNYFVPYRLQFSSHVTQLFWVPNHMAPGWWFGVLALLYARKEIDFAVIAAFFALSLIWSPLAMIGALPFVCLFAV
ncbi:MAG: hypothetical protein N2444_06290, partial [Methylocystis sp.]|nr:hypothetical protein [Methylocystis sp.]